MRNPPRINIANKQFRPRFCYCFDVLFTKKGPMADMRAQTVNRVLLLHLSKKLLSLL
jgi:hypothetical protein